MRWQANWDRTQGLAGQIEGRPYLLIFFVSLLAIQYQFVAANLPGYRRGGQHGVESTRDRLTSRLRQPIGPI